MGSLLKILALCASVLMAQASTGDDQAAVQQKTQKLQELFDRLSNSLIICEQSNTTTTGDEMVAVEGKLQELREQFDRWNNSLNVCEQSKTTTTTTTTTTPTTTTAEPAKTMKVYTQRLSVTDYLFAEDLPSLSQFTICMRMKLLKTTSKWRPYVSIATKDSPSGNGVLISAISWKLRMYLSDVKYEGNLMTQTDFEKLMKDWNKHCWTYRSGGKFKWFATSSDSAVLKEIDSFDAPAHTVPAGGSLVLFQDQDSMLGGFESIQATEGGQVADFNFWNYEMNMNALNSLTCDSKGSVKSWSDLKAAGSPNFTEQKFKCSA